MELKLEQVAGRLSEWLGMGSRSPAESNSYGLARLGLAPPEPTQTTQPGARSRPTLTPLVRPPKPQPPAEPAEPIEDSSGQRKSLLRSSRRSIFRQRSHHPDWSGPFTRRSFKLPVGLAYRLRIESHRQDRYLWDLAAEAFQQYLDEKQM